MKYKPNNGEELKALCNDESVYLGDIDTSLITDMSGLFLDSTRKDFSGIEKWDTSNVANMSEMFKNSCFNKPLDNWDVSNVTDMSKMFAQTPFNQPLISWDVSAVEDMSYMFFCTPFNHSLNSWDVSRLRKASFMFAHSSFSHPLDSWDVGSLKEAKSMFRSTSYSHSLDSWGGSECVQEALKDRNEPKDLDWFFGIETLYLKK